MRPAGFLFVSCLVATGFAPSAEDSTPPPTAQLDGLHALIKPRPGESRWMEIDWHPTVWEARQKAAREGKPLFLLAGSGGAPPAGC